jgi:hypothetical protein
LHGIHDEDFEHLCIDPIEGEAGVTRAELKRPRSVAQFGVDVEGFDLAQAPSTVLSAKRCKRVKPSQLKGRERRLSRSLG